MQVHLLWLDNCLEFDDHDVVLLGIYRDVEQSLAAQIGYERLRNMQWPFNDTGKFWRSVVTVGEDLIKVHPKVVLSLMDGYKESTCGEPSIARWDFGQGDELHVCERHDAMV